MISSWCWYGLHLWPLVNIPVKWLHATDDTWLTILPRATIWLTTSIDNTLDWETRLRKVKQRSRHMYVMLDNINRGQIFMILLASAIMMNTFCRNPMGSKWLLFWGGWVSRVSGHTIPHHTWVLVILRLFKDLEATLPEEVQSKQI